MREKKEEKRRNDDYLYFIGFLIEKPGISTPSIRTP